MALPWTGNWVHPEALSARQSKSAVEKEGAGKEDEREILDFIRHSHFTNFDDPGRLTGLEVRIGVWSCHSAPRMPPWHRSEELTFLRLTGASAESINYSLPQLGGERDNGILKRHLTDPQTIEILAQSRHFQKNGRKEPLSAFQQTRGLPHQQRRHNPFDDNPDAAAQADKHDKDVTEQERLQEEENRQLAQAMHNSEEEYPSLPGTDDEDGHHYGRTSGRARRSSLSLWQGG